jgi:hypothetical protein
MTAPVISAGDLVERFRALLADYDADLQATIAAGILPDREAFGEEVYGLTYAEISAAIIRILELEAALKPFAALGEQAAWLEKPDDKGAWGFDDFRRAISALGEQPEVKE